MRYDAIFITAALTCLLLGEGLGIWMGVNQDFTLTPVHAHVNLVGWATLAIYGLIHRAFPALGTSRLAAVQCGLAIFGAVLLPIGIAIAVLQHSTDLAKAGALVVIVATLLFLILFSGKAWKGAPA